MRSAERLAIASIVAIALLAPENARAFLTPGKTSGTEIALLPLGPGLWQLTIESGDVTVNNGGQIGIRNAVSFDPNPVLCDNDQLLICAGILGDDVDPSLAEVLFVIVAVNQWNLATGDPQIIGSVRDSGVLPRFLTEQEICSLIISEHCYEGFADPVTFMNPIPEPGSAALLAAAIGLVTSRALRRRAACEAPNA